MPIRDGAHDREPEAARTRVSSEFRGAFAAIEALEDTLTLRCRAAEPDLVGPTNQLKQGLKFE